MSDTTLKIIQRAQAGDRLAFAAFFEQYKNLVFRSAYLILGSPEDAEDVLQEVFVHVYKSLAGFDPRKGAPTTWLHRVTVNQCLNHRRKRSLVAFHLEEMASLDPLKLKSDFPEAHLANEEAIWQAIHHLSERLRVVVVLRYYQEFSYAEIAQILEIPLGTVKSRLDLALKNLRQALEQQEFRPGPARDGAHSVEAGDEL